MTVENLTDTSDQFADLLEKGSGPCATIIQSLRTRGRDVRMNAELLRRAFDNAHQAVERYACKEHERIAIRARLNDAFRETGIRTCEGIGVFVSEHVSRVVEFPFPVDDYVLVADSFETRDVLYLQQRLIPYYVVSLTKSEIQLFRARQDLLEEIHNRYFPMGVHGFDKHLPFRTGSPVRTEIGDAALEAAKVAGRSELIVTGPKQMASDFVKEFPSPDRIIGQLQGSFDSRDHRMFCRVVWEECRRGRENETLRLIQKADEQGLRSRARGIRKVWEAANSGKGLLLLVERYYRRPAFQPEGQLQIRLNRPGGASHFIADAVDDVIELVLRKGGRVVFTREGQLRKYHGIVLIYRY